MEIVCKEVRPKCFMQPTLAVAYLYIDISSFKAVQEAAPREAFLMFPS